VQARQVMTNPAVTGRNETPVDNASDASGPVYGNGSIRRIEISTASRQFLPKSNNPAARIVPICIKYQSTNADLTAVNSQLQDTLERQRRTSDDLQNILYSIDVATLFLDTELNIRFFTPATQLLFKLGPGDVGEPVAGLQSLAADDTLLLDARTVLKTLMPIERETESRSGGWYNRRVLPYRTRNRGVEGVVITFTDITERKRAKRALELAKQQAERANAAKSRFLAAASHDLRQPLQTLHLLQGLLAKVVEGEGTQKLIARFDQTLAGMSGMLNTLLDINQIDSGAVRVEKVTFPIGDLLNVLRDEFTCHAEDKNISLHVLPCSLLIHSDPRLLEQMIRNLLSNALKYTKRGKVLLGCRRRNGTLSVEICDTGPGIPDEELQSIFEEYRQLDNAARERSQGLGLGLSIVKGLGNLLDHRIYVRSQPGRGSVFGIELILPERRSPTQPEPDRCLDEPKLKTACHASILIIEDDPQVRDLLEHLLKDEGYRTAVASDGTAALRLVEQGTIRPDIILTDFNLPNGLDGLQVTAKLREKLLRKTPVIVLTGDISTDTSREIARQNCVKLNKPVKLKELAQMIQQIVALPAPIEHAVPCTHTADDTAQPVIFIVDDDSAVREALRDVLERDGRSVQAYSTCEAFIEAYRPGGEACLLIDAYLPGMNGLELLRWLGHSGHRLPAIMITGDSDVPMAVQAMKAGAWDFIEKPIGYRELLEAVANALKQSRNASKLLASQATAAGAIAGLTPRQRQIMEMVLAGHPSKNISADLGISQRTVENHRASIMERTGSKSLPALARLAYAAGGNGAEGPSLQRYGQASR
jgi:two-component system, chemotaxis family, CheB/CheR fusion protein